MIIQRRTAAIRNRALGAALIIVIFGGCASLPKGHEVVSARKVEAAHYLELGDEQYRLGQYRSALQFYLEALDTSLLVDHVEGAIAARGSLGRTYRTLRRTDDAEREYSDALEDALALGRNELIAASLANLGELRYSQGRLDEALELLLHAESLAAAGGATAAVVAHDLGIIEKKRGRPETAEEYLREAARSNEEDGRWIELASNRYVLASIAAERGEITAALGWAERALEADKRAENSPGIADDLEALAKLRRRNGEEEAAFDLYRRALGVRIGIDDLDGVARCLTTLVELAIGLGKADYVDRYRRLLSQIPAE